jgi:hypothetical protein
LYGHLLLIKGSKVIKTNNKQTKKILRGNSETKSAILLKCDIILIIISTALEYFR